MCKNLKKATVYMKSRNIGSTNPLKDHNHLRMKLVYSCVFSILKVLQAKRQAFIITTKQTRKVIAFTIFSETPRISLSYIYGCNLILPHFRLSKKRLLERFSLYIFYKNLQFHKGLCCFVYLFWC